MLLTTSHMNLDSVLWAAAPSAGNEPLLQISVTHYWLHFMYWSTAVGVHIFLLPPSAGRYSDSCSRTLQQDRRLLPWDWGGEILFLSVVQLWYSRQTYQHESPKECFTQAQITHKLNDQTFIMTSGFVKAKKKKGFVLQICLAHSCLNREKNLSDWMWLLPVFYKGALI